MKVLLILLNSFLLLTCTNKTTELPDQAPGKDTQAEVLEVEITGTEGSYTFSVRVKSPDTGCDQYADWWEVIDQTGKLKYRRVLLHSHVDEQPFIRSGGPVPIEVDELVYIRAHMNTSGYGTAVYVGSARDGFEASTLAADFAKDLAQQEPLPKDCAF